VLRSELSQLYHICYVCVIWGIFGNRSRKKRLLQPVFVSLILESDVDRCQLFCYCRSVSSILTIQITQRALYVTVFFFSLAHIVWSHACKSVVGTYKASGFITFDVAVRSSLNLRQHMFPCCTQITSTVFAAK